MQKGVVRKRRPAQSSEYGRQLQAKQELKKEYILKEQPFKNYVKKIVARKTHDQDASALLLQSLEQRLDSVVFRSGFAKTRREAKQMVSHGHIFLNGSRMSIPSHAVKKGDIISVSPQALKKTLFKNALLSIAKYQPPPWLEVRKEKLEAQVKELPKFEDIQITVDIPLVFEFYSR